MASAITALNIKMKMDTASISAGSDAVRKDVQRVNRIMQQAKTDTEKYREASESLARMQQAGKLSAEKYAQGIEFITKKYKQADQEVGPLASKISDLKARITPTNIALGAGAAALATLAAGAIAARKAVATAMDEIEKLRDLQNMAEGIGMSASRLQSFGLAMKKITGADLDRVTDAVAELRQRLGEATVGTGEAVEALRILNMDAQRLSMLSPLEQFREVAKALQGVTNASQRAYVADQLFGEQAREMAAAFRSNAQSIADVEKQLQSYGAVLTDTQHMQAMRARQEMDEMQMRLNAIKLQFAGELAPAIRVAGDELGRWLPMVRSLETTMQAVSLTAVGMLGEITTLAQRAKAEFMFAFDPLESLKKYQASFSGDTTRNMVSKFLEERNAAAKAAQEASQRMQAEGEALRFNEAIQDAYKAQTTQLQAQLALMTKGAAEAQRITLQAQGFNKEQVAALMTLQQTIDARKAEKQQIMEGVAAMIEQDRENKRILDNLRSAGRDLMEKHNPVLAVSRQLAELGVLLRRGMIDQATFIKERNKILGDALGTQEKMQQQDALQFGSKEAADMVQRQVFDTANQQIAKLEQQRLIQQTHLEVARRMEAHLSELQPIRKIR